MSSISPAVTRLKNNLEVIVRSAEPEDAEELLEMTKAILTSPPQKNFLLQPSRR